MDGFKLRAWNSNKKTWETGLAVNMNGEIVGCNHPGDYELSRWTGLVDKNGVEIYEGDVVQFHTDSPTHWIQIADLKIGRTNSEIVWHEGKFHCNIIAEQGIGDVLNWNVTTRVGDLKVAGNIYETPELLKEHAA